MSIPELDAHAISNMIRPSFNPGHILSKRTNCDNAVDGQPHYDCDNRPLTLNSDGTCGTSKQWKNADNGCAAYCEVKRTTFPGPQQDAPGIFGVLTGVNESINIQSGIESTISVGFSIGGEGAWEEAITAGASFDFSVETTKTMTIEREGAPVENCQSKWIFWPILTTSCGSVTATTYRPALNNGGKNPFQSSPSCHGSVTTTGNVCSTVPLTMDGQAAAFWTQVYIKPDGTLCPSDVQTESYNLYSSLAAS
ncbi:hypothetical protein F5Y19DRAFT_470489 [Xylariaceae sp. FL1651]|nr:hypothetical protein F5Y19DRAFT_470489 [Xylariaceae sp. FL1651]